jgi:hypothetical protein
MPNDPLDDQITYTLQTDTVVMPDQKARAWEAVRERAAQQVILAPYAVTPAPVETRPGLWVLAERALAGIIQLFVDDTRYCRAACSRAALIQMPPQGHGMVAYPGHLMYMSLY